MNGEMAQVLVSTLSTHALMSDQTFAWLVCVPLILIVCYPVGVFLREWIATKRLPGALRMVWLACASAVLAALFAILINA